MLTRKITLTLFILLISITPLNTTLALITPPEVTDDSSTIERIYGADMSSEIYNTISQMLYRDYIIKLTENGSRATGTHNNEKARRWIVKKLRELTDNRIEIEILGNSKNVVGRLPGWIPYDAPVLIVGGHYDTVSGAPGANDDGTGVAAALELARVMSMYEWPLDIYFCAWNAEEVGLIGSSEVAEIFAQRGIEILMYYNIDMLLVEDPNASPDERVLMVYNEGTKATFHSSKYWAELTRMMSNNIGKNLILPLSSGGFFGWTRSDHYSFVQEGYQNVIFAFESGFSLDDDYHQSTDVWDNPAYNYTVARETVASIGASLAFTMSRAYGQQVCLEYNGALKGGMSDKYYIEISSETSIRVLGNWERAGIKFSLLSPYGVVLEETEFVGSRGYNETLFNTDVSSWGLYSIIVTPLTQTPTPYDITIKYESDMEGNGIPDSEEYWLDTILYTSDHDNDGLTDATEIILGTNPHNEDSDEDGTPDGWELDNGFDPLIPDSMLDPDDDGVTNYYEYLNGTSPRFNDTDLDQMPDGWEIEYGLDPVVDDAQEDLDYDGLTNLEEFEQGKNPTVSDNPQLDLEPVFIVVGGLLVCILAAVLFKRHGL